MTPDDSARNRKMRKMMSLNCSICLMPIFGFGMVYGIWTPKGGPPQYRYWEDQSRVGACIDSSWIWPRYSGKTPDFQFVKFVAIHPQLLR